MLPFDQAGALPGSQSPKTAEDGAVMRHPASTKFQVAAQYCSVFEELSKDFVDRGTAANMFDLVSKREGGIVVIWRARIVRLDAMIER
jgi:hypothetical protein